MVLKIFFFFFFSLVNYQNLSRGFLDRLEESARLHDIF